MTQARLYVVAYDISCPRRWRRVQKIVKSICRRGQLSVFVCRATPARIEKLDRDLRDILHRSDDRLLIVDLGLAHTAEAQVKAINPIADIADLKAAVL